MITFNINNKRGFTLVEVLVVVLIIGIISAVATPYYKDYVERQKSVMGINNLRQVVDSVERYRALHNQISPDNFKVLDIAIKPNMLSDSNTKYNDGTFTYTIESTRVVGARNTGGYSLIYTLDTDVLSCTSSTANYCSDKLHILD